MNLNYKKAAFFDTLFFFIVIVVLLVSGIFLVNILGPVVTQFKSDANLGPDAQQA